MYPVWLLKWIAIADRVFWFPQRRLGWQSAIWYLSLLHIVYHILYMRLYIYIYIYNIGCATLGFSSDCVGEASTMAFHLLSRFFEMQIGLQTGLERVQLEHPCDSWSVRLRSLLVLGSLARTNISPRLRGRRKAIKVGPGMAERNVRGV